MLRADQPRLSSQAGAETTLMGDKIARSSGHLPERVVSEEARRRNLPRRSVIQREGTIMVPRPAVTLRDSWLYVSGQSFHTGGNRQVVERGRGGARMRKAS